MYKIILLYFFACIGLSIFAQNDTIVLAVDSISAIDSVKITDEDLARKTEEILSPKLKYLSSDKIDAYIYLTKEELPSLTDDIIKTKLGKIPTTLNLRWTPDIGNQIRSYVYKQRRFVVDMLTKAQYFFPLYEEELAKKNLPFELKYVSIIESHLKPNAKSRMGAAGLWQFMYATAKYKGMHITSLEDERYNPKKSTAFAAEYFEQLYSVYNDWLLAISAYNAGEGNINRAIRASGGYLNYWVSRPYMPSETQQYVPKIIAMMYVMHYAEDYLLYPRQPEQHYLDVSEVKLFDKLSLDFVSEYLGVHKEELKKLNPSLTKDIVPHRDTGYSLVVPNYALNNYENNKGYLYNDPYFDNEHKIIEEKVIADYKPSGSGSYTTYVVTTGDNLGYIAQKFNCKVSDIKRWNGLHSNFLSIGKKLKIYGAKNNVANTIAKENSTNEKIGFNEDEVKKIACACHFHKIVSGDNLWDISTKYNSTIEQIKRENNIPKNWRLKLGVYLKIPKS